MNANVYDPAFWSRVQFGFTVAYHYLFPPPIRPRASEQSCAASFAQQRLWFLDQLEGGSATYNIALVLRLTGTLDVNALQRSLDQIVSRHAVLRTTFSLIDGQLMQQINPSKPVVLRQSSLENLPVEQREVEAHRALVAEAQQSFDLTRDLLIRAGSYWIPGSRIC
jgi:hypothetical protein